MRNRLKYDPVNGHLRITMHVWTFTKSSLIQAWNTLMMFTFFIVDSMYTLSNSEITCNATCDGLCSSLQATITHTDMCFAAISYTTYACHYFSSEIRALPEVTSHLISRILDKVLLLLLLFQRFIRRIFQK